VIDVEHVLVQVWQLRELAPDARGALVAAAIVEDRPRDAVVVAQGEIGHDAFVVIEGRLEVRIAGRRGLVPVAIVGPGEMFGELAVLDPAHLRTASVVSLGPVKLLRIDGAVLADAIEHVTGLRDQLEAAAQRMAIARFIKGATLLAELSSAALAHLADRVRARSVEAGEVVIRQGERGSECFLIRSGELEVIDERDGGARRLAVLQAGALFGEAAVLTGAPRNATVRALADAELLVLRREDVLEAMTADRRVAERLVGMLEARSRPQRLDGIELHERRMADGATVAILKDPRRGRYFWLSAEAMFLWERLDGRRTIRDLTVELFAEHDVLAPDMVMDILHKLAANEFIELAHVDQRELAAHVAARPLSRRLAPTFDWSMTIGRCDRFFTLLYDAGLRHAYTRVGAFVTAAIALVGFGGFLAIAPSIAGSLLHGGMFARAGAALIPLIALAVVLHELGHGLAAKAAGAQVDRVGIGWYWFRPVVSVDTSDAWLAPRARRMLVDAGGLLVNLLIAGIAGIVAFLSPRASSVAVLFWIYALWSYVAVLRNLNPLLEYDGYYLLIDWLDKPNLRARSLAWIGSAMPHALRDPAALRRHRFELLYGMGALLYIGVLTLWLMFVYRYTVQGWVARLLPAALAATATQVLALAISGAALWQLVMEIRKERANAHSHARVSVRPR
jgi:CRP-like cAMP-binding protein